jgi:Tol biopolymer transport system component/tRNA A-37 threonylcarbamoyl transferase component Bud32
MADLGQRLTAALGDRYRVDRRIGQGGMAAVYLADDLKHDRRVAIKVLHEDLGATLGPERFLAEIKTTARLQHPHILPLLDSGSAGGLLYYVMPYVEGESLRDRLEREKQLPIDDAIRIAREIADALGAAHAVGVIHRDIKPENILLQGGHALVADFGIALAVQSAGAGRMTQTGLSLGTPQYMAPEQAMGDKSVDARADIYSLGAVTYEMLIGEPPFTGATVQAIVAKVINADPEPPTMMRKTVPSHVEEAVLHALAKLPADRPATAAAFVAALGGTGTHRATTSAGRNVAPIRTNRVAMMVGGALAVLAGVAIGWTMSRAGEAEGSSSVSRSYLLQPKDETLPFGTTDFVQSPDGQQFVYVGPGERPGTTQLWRKRRSDLHAERLPSTEGANSPFFSPDGSWIAFRVVDKLVKLPLAGGAPVTLVSGWSVLPLRGAWLEDGRIVSGGGSGLHILSSDGSSKRLLASASNGAFKGYNPELVEAIPGGKAVLVHTCPVNCVRNAIYVVDLETGNDRQLLLDARSPLYVSTGHLLYVLSNGSVMAAPFDAATATITGPARPVLERVGSQLSIGANGTLMYREGEFGVASRMMWVDRTGKAAPVDTVALSKISSARFTPDGRRAVVSVVSNSTQDLWIREIGGVQTKLSSDTRAHFRPTLTPDGKTVYYVTGDTTFELAYRPLDGSGAARVVPTGGLQVVEAAISPDGRAMILRTGGGGGRRELLAYRPGQDSVARVIARAPYTRMGFSFSPDGRFVVYSGFETSADGEIYVSPFPDIDSARWQVSPRGGTSAYWSPDGREIFYISATGDLTVAKVSSEGTFRVASQERLFSLMGYVIDAGYTMFQPMPGGQRFAMLRKEPFPGELVVVDNWLRELKEKLKEQK